jgi:regulator of protease activity HflC (stomatin/prohibitin superfamily)
MFSIVIGALLLLVAIISAIVGAKTACKRAGATVSVVAILLAVVIIGVSCISTVPTGHTGILTTFGRVEDRNLPEGMNIHAPWQNITTMTNKEQIFSETNVCFSADLQEVAYTYTVKYSLLSSAAPNIYKTVGVNYFDILIKPQVNNAIKAEFGLVEAEHMTELRTQLQSNIDTTVSEFASKYGIEVTVVIDDFDFSDAYTNAIESKQVAEQEALRDKTQQQMETERTRQAAERTKIQAENDAAIREINANADAEAARIKAQADFEVAQLEADAIAYKGEKEAEATKALADAISEEVVAYEYAQNWSGELPTYMMGNGALPIVDIPMGVEE